MLLAAAAFVITLGLGCRSNHYDQAYYYQGAPRTNLYPLTSPASGTVARGGGYGPTRVSGPTDYYGQGAGYGYYGNTGYNTGYYANTTNTGYYNTGSAGSGYNTTAGYGTGSGYGGSYNTYAGYDVGQDPFPAGTVGATMGTGAGVISNPYGGGYCRVEDIRPGMNPMVPIQDPPVVIGNNINLGNTSAGYGYTAGYTTGGYTQPATYSTGYTGGYTGGYTTGTAGYTTGASAVVSSVLPSNANYDSGPVPYCGPGVTCPPDPRVDTSVYGGVTNLGAAPQVQTSYGESVGTADLTTGTFGYGGGAGYGGSYGASYGGGGAMVGAGYTTGTDSYAGGAYPSIIDTVPSRHGDNLENWGRGRPGVVPAPNFGPGPGMGMGGLMLVPARDIPPRMRPQDAAPSQWFEVVRPGNGPIQLGRISASCVCVGVRVPKRQFAAGERALIEVRVLSRPPANNLTYGIFVNVVEPHKTVLDADVTISL